MPDRPRYMISVAAELAGLHPQTMRMYENRGLVRPARTPGGTRLYSENDVERLQADPAPDDRARASTSRAWSTCCGSRTSCAA